MAAWEAPQLSPRSNNHSQVVSERLNSNRRKEVALALALWRTTNNQKVSFQEEPHHKVGLRSSNNKAVGSVLRSKTAGNQRRHHRFSASQQEAANPRDSQDSLHSRQHLRQALFMESQLNKVYLGHPTRSPGLSHKLKTLRDS